MAFNPLDLLKNSAMLQEKVAEMEEQLKGITAVGEAGGGLVRITLNGRFECIAIEFDPIAVDNRDIPMLQTLVKSAHHAAFQKITEALQSKAAGFGLENFLKS
jgi:DNA-binding YbaB/EbfC family protein